MSASVDPWNTWLPAEASTTRLAIGGGDPSEVRSVLRIEMVTHTNEFLSWALAEERGLTPIPRLRVDRGGFDPIMRKAGARRLSALWWSQALGVELHPD